MQGKSWKLEALYIYSSRSIFASNMLFILMFICWCLVALLQI